MASLSYLLLCWEVVLPFLEISMHTTPAQITWKGETTKGAVTPRSERHPVIKVARLEEQQLRCRTDETYTLHKSNAHTRIRRCWDALQLARTPCIYMKSENFCWNAQCWQWCGTTKSFTGHGTASRHKLIKKQKIFPPIHVKLFHLQHSHEPMKTG